jgi:hypothetical protein
MHAMNMKQITVKILGSDSDPIDINLMPEVTVGELLAALNLQDYVLASVSHPQKVFAEEEVLYDTVMDGDRFWLMSHVCDLY